jgi:regulator of protease activity HflC (stomatin/prohibitin superfamily)
MLGFFYVIKQYERGVQFRLGRVRNGVRGPGVIIVIPLVDRVRRVSLRIVTMPIESPGIITRDNVSVGVSAVAYYRVEDAVRSIVAIDGRQPRAGGRRGGTARRQAARRERARPGLAPAERRRIRPS